MSTKANYFKIGLFVISAFSLAVVGVVILGAGALFQKRIIVETYFDESVQGLDVGSPVKFRGLQIGKVEEITFASREYPTSQKYILVRMSLFQDYIGMGAPNATGSILEKEIPKGLRVRLSFQGVTGTAFMEADYLNPRLNRPLPYNWEPHYPYLPSASSTVTRLSESLERIMRNLEQINYLGISTGMQKTFTAMTKTLEATNIENIGQEVNQLLTEIRETNRRLGGLLAGLDLKGPLADFSDVAVGVKRLVENSEQPIGRFLVSLRQTTEQINELAGKVNTISGEIPQTMAQLQATLRRLNSLLLTQQQDMEVTAANIRLISENLKELTDDAKKYPSHLLFGEPPARSEPGNRK